MALDGVTWKEKSVIQKGWAFDTRADENQFDYSRPTPGVELLGLLGDHPVAKLNRRPTNERPEILKTTKISTK